MTRAQDESIEDLIEKILSSKTKLYFEEVFSSYNNKNYRAAMVGLWSVVVFDLYEKILDLKDIYDDSSAKHIMKKIEDARTANPKSSEWEIELVEIAETKFKWIDKSTKMGLENIQQQRHLAAHPVIDDDVKLVAPSRDEVKAKMRLVLEKVLIVHATTNSNLFNTIVDELKEHKKQFRDISDVKKFLENRFLKRISEENLMKLIKSLWRITFFTEDENCNSNRDINFLALIVLCRKVGNKIEQVISSNSVYYSKISPKFIEMVILFLSNLEEIDFYNKLDDSFRLMIDNAIEEDKNLLCLSFFKYDNLEDFFEKFVTSVRKNSDLSIKHENIISALKRCQNDSQDMAKKVLSFVLENYVQSSNYNHADYNFKILFKFVEQWDEDMFVKFVHDVSSNRQTYNRFLAETEHKDLLEIYLRKFKKKIIFITDKYNSNSHVWKSFDDYVTTQHTEE